MESCSARRGRLHRWKVREKHLAQDQLKGRAARVTIGPRVLGTRCYVRAGSVAWTLRIRYQSRLSRRVHDGLHVGLLVSRLTERCLRLHTQVDRLSGVKRREPVLTIAWTELYTSRQLGCEFRTQWVPGGNSGYKIRLIRSLAVLVTRV